MADRPKHYQFLRSDHSGHVHNSSDLDAKMTVVLTGSGVDFQAANIDPGNLQCALALLIAANPSAISIASNIETYMKSKNIRTSDNSKFFCSVAKLVGLA